MALTDLPYTVFFEFISYLSATEALLCRRISSGIRHALTRSDLSISLILLHFPRSLEGRTLRRYLEDEDHDALRTADWAAVFALLVRRYVHLGDATPWKTAKITVCKDSRRLRGVTPWHRFLLLDERTAALHYWDPVWTFAPREGLLVYPTAQSLSSNDTFVYLARDVATGTETTVPFDTTGKVVRRVRLSHGILVFEWCEEEGYHSLNEREAAHRHFATAYNVTRGPGWDGIIPQREETSASSTSSTRTDRASWIIEFRSEWKIHYLGLPLSHQDRFFSAHNSTHYIVYIWQPTRSPWGEDEPLERLIIWDIQSPSPYRPSLDPSGRNAPRDSENAAAPGPRIIRRMINAELDIWGIRQSETPCLRALAIDECTWNETTQSACGHVFFLTEQHRWCAGPHSSPNPPRQHHVISTGIPLTGEGPVWLDDCGGNNSNRIENMGMSFCWRGPRRRLRLQRATHETETPSPDASVACPPSSSLRDLQSNHLAELWPGRAPCWRHDDFPYLTVSEVFDVEAGVRISARHCFMMETLSVHIRPQLRVEGVDTIRSRRGRRSSSNRSLNKADNASSKMSNGTLENDSHVHSSPEKPPTTRSDGPEGEEVQFSDDLWGELMGKGHICGDERWVVGEDDKGDVTILIF